MTSRLFSWPPKPLQFKDINFNSLITYVNEGKGGLKKGWCVFGSGQRRLPVLHGSSSAEMPFVAAVTAAVAAATSVANTANGLLTLKYLRAEIQQTQYEKNTYQNT